MNPAISVALLLSGGRPRVCVSPNSEKALLCQSCRCPEGRR
uniref:Thymus cell antigen 1, theta n=1 Tax=Mus musculus TaxID=10090 RepID=A0A1L1SRS7_MOUSE